MPKTRRAQSQNPLSRPLAVLRQVDFDKLSEASVEMLSQTNVNYLVSEGELLWFSDGYILNDMPRMSDLVREIMAATLGFAVARTDTGEILAKFGPDGLKDAEQAVAGSRLQVVREYEILGRIETEDQEAEAVPAS